MYDGKEQQIKCTSVLANAEYWYNSIYCFDKRIPKTRISSNAFPFNEYFYCDQYYEFFISICHLK